MTPKKQKKLNYLPFFGYQFFIFLVQLIIFIACIEYIQILYTNEILPDKQVKESYLQTSCTIVSKNLSQKSGLVHGYRADFLISYSVNNNSYRTWVTGNGLDQAFFPDRETQEATLSQFQIEASYPCWYNPETPQIAVLVLRHNWASTLPLAIPTVIALIVFYYILKEVLQFLGWSSSAIQKKNRFKK